jgi:hypothetical protein
MNVLVDTPVWSLALRRKPRHLNAAEKRIVAEWRQRSAMPHSTAAATRRSKRPEPR